MKGIDPSTPVILLGGASNGVAVARNLGRLGIGITGLGAPDSPAMTTRFCRRKIPIPPGKTASQHWSDTLLSGEWPELAGSIVFAFDDEGLEFMDANRDALKARYVLEDCVPELRKAMLDKQATLAIAQRMGIPAPRYWPVRQGGDVAAIRDEIRFPVMVKPLNSFAFQESLGRKLFIVEDDFEEVIEKVALCHSRGHEVMVVEMVPGPDSLLSSYYTYRTADGKRLFDYTKSVIRRWPVNRGTGTFHQSEWLPETAELGQKFFDRLEWQGIANIEFKRDPRDGQLKVIEVNARFTAGHRLVTAAGAPIDAIIYCYLTNQPVPSFDTYSHSLRLWDPVRDFLAFRDLNREGKLGLLAWLGGLAAQKKVLPLFSLDDPGPSLVQIWSAIKRGLTGATGQIRKAG